MTNTEKTGVLDVIKHISPEIYAYALVLYNDIKNLFIFNPYSTHEYEYASGILYILLDIASMNTGKIPTIHPIGNTSKITAGVFNWRITVFSEHAELDDLIVKSLFENITISWSGFILYTPLSADTVIVSLELLYRRVS